MTAMLKREGGTQVKNGFYWNLHEWEMVMVPRQGGVLPGDATQAFLKVPVLGLLVIGPLMGALYAFFLPFIGFAMLFGFAGRKAGAAASTGFMEVMTVVAPHWQPGEAYLAAKRRAKAARPAGEEQKALDTLEREIDERRKKEQ